MASVTIEVDLPPGVEIIAYERHQDGHGFEVRWPLPERCRCQRCGQEDHAHIEYKTSPQAVRDLDVWGRNFTVPTTTFLLTTCGTGNAVLRWSPLRERARFPQPSLNC